MDQVIVKSKKPSLKQFLIQSAKIVIIGILLYFLYRQISNHWEDIKQYQWEIDYQYLIFSIIAGLITFSIMATVWKKVIGTFGYNLRIRDAFRIVYLSDLGRYIPGKIWQLFGVLYLAKQKGIPPEQAGASFALVQMFAIPASFLVFVICAQIEPALLIDHIGLLGEKASYFITGSMIVVCLILIFWPSKILKIGNWILRRLKRPEVEFRLDKKVAMIIFLGYCIGWTCYGTAFWLFIKAVTVESDISPVVCIGLFNAAYQIGYLTLVAPGGFGPRELVMGTMLTPFVGPIGPAIAIAARLWAIVIEAMAALIALIIRK